MSTTSTPTSLEVHECGFCGRAMPFEIPDCADGHDAHCPDRVCTGCGVVLVVGPVPLAARHSA